MNNDSEDSSEADDSALRKRLEAEDFKPDGDGMKWMAAAPTVLVAGAFKVIRTAAEKARKMVEKGR